MKKKCWICYILITILLLTGNSTVVCAEDNYSIDTVDNIEWISGTYHYATGIYQENLNRICFNKYQTADDNTYIINLPYDNLRLKILEVDDTGKIIKGTEFTNGNKWKAGEDTVQYTAYIYSREGSTKYTFNDFQNMILLYSDFGLIKYVPYLHNTIMNELSATQFINEMNVGWNLGNSLDSKCELKSRGYDANLMQEVRYGNPYVVKNLIDFVHDCGFNTIRIPVTWYYNSYEDGNNNLRVGVQWLARVKEVVDYAIQNDMYVIINSHHDQPIFYAGVSDEEMKQVLKNVRNVWLDISNYFIDYDEHLIFEAFNEIDNLEQSWQYSEKAAIQMNQMNQAFVDTVRNTGGNNNRRLLMVPTLLDGTSAKILNSFTLPKDTAKDRLLVQVHTYSQKLGQDIEKDFSLLEAFSHRIGAPVIIGEFGTTNSFEVAEYRDKHASNFVARAAAHGIKCIWWDNGSNYSIINRRDLSESNFSMIQALINGEALDIKNIVVFDNPSQFVLRMPNLTTGKIEEKYWGTITTDFDGNAVPIASGKKYVLTLTAVNEAADIWLQRIVFYDIDGQFISGLELQKMQYIFTIPDNARYIRVSINNPYKSIEWDEYSKLILNSDLQLNLYSVD